MLDNDTVVSVNTAKKLIFTNLGCVGFGLEPMPGNKGVFPITAIINGDTTNPLRLENRHIYTHHEPIHNVEVVVTEGGGEEGDKWRLTLKRSGNETLEVRHPTNTRGELITARNAGEVLFFLNTNEHRNVLNYYWDATQDMNYVLSWTATNDILGLLPGQEYVAAGIGGHDLTRFERVLLVVEAYSPISRPFGYAYVKPFVRWVSPKTGKVLETIYCGSLEDLGDNDSASYDYNNPKPLVIELGAKSELVQGYRTATQWLPPYAQFGLEVRDFAGIAANPFDYGRLDFRMYAVGY